MINAEVVIKYIIQKNKALQARYKLSQYASLFFCKLFDFLKRASLGLSVRVKASVSIEASIAIPVFLFCFLEILSLLNYISVYSGVLYAMKTVGDPTCIYGYAYDLAVDSTQEVALSETIISAALFSEVYLDSQIRQQCNSSLYENTIQGGAEGITLLGSHVDRNDASLSIVARYTMEPLITFAGTEFSVICRYYGRLWTGYSFEEETLEEYVYITQNGSVYHRKEDCTHLKLSVTSVTKEELEQERNNSGGKYTACDICISDKGSQESYYITKSGERYHEKLSCSGLKRTVYRVKLSDVEDWGECSRCGV